MKSVRVGGRKKSRKKRLVAVDENEVDIRMRARGREVERTGRRGRMAWAE